MIVVALDLSLTSTGWAYTDPHERTGRHSGTWPTAKLRGVERLCHLRHQIEGLVGHDDYDRLIIEELPPGTRGNSMHGVAELHGVIKVALHDWEQPPATYINPTSVKIMATGRGNADKAAVLSAAIQRLDYTGSSFDEADALWMLAMGMQHHGHPLCDLPKTHLRALDKVVWA